jgi:hypothetical protein
MIYTVEYQHLMRLRCTRQLAAAAVLGSLLLLSCSLHTLFNMPSQCCYL